MKIKTTALIIAIVLGGFFSISFLKIKTIKVSNPTNCLNDNSQAVTQFKNKNLILLNTSSQENQIAKSVSCAKSVKIKKIYPSTLELTLEYFQPVANIDGTELQVTSSGLITEKTNGNLPTIFMPQAVDSQSGKTITDPQILFALKVAEELEKSDFLPANIRILDAGDIAVYSNQEAVALFTSQEDASSQVDSLQSILAKAKIDAAKIAKVDLRFAKPVLVYK